MVLTTLQPASLAPCTKSITTFNKAAEHLGPRYTYNKHPFLPDPTNSTITSPYMLMKGGKKRRATKKMMKKKTSGKSKSKKRVHKSKKRVHKSKKRVHKSKKRVHKSKKRVHKRHTKKYMKGGSGIEFETPYYNPNPNIGSMQKGGGHGDPPYGLPQGLVNIGREIEYGIKSLYESAVGGNTPVNPDPSIQPIGKAGSRNYLPALVDPQDAVKYAQERVATL